MAKVKGLRFDTAPDDVRAVAGVLHENGYRYRDMGGMACVWAAEILDAVRAGESAPCVDERYRLGWEKACQEAERWVDWRHG